MSVVRLGDHFLRAGKGQFPNLLRIMFHKTGRRIELGEWALSASQASAVLAKQYGAGGGCAFVNDKDFRGHRFSPPWWLLKSA